MSNWEVQVHTGDPNADQAQIANLRAQAAAHGMDITIQPAPTGGYIVRAVPMGQAGGYGGAPAGGYGGGGYGAMAASAAPSGYASPAAATADAAAPPLGRQRIEYLRKVYGLLTASAIFAIISGFLCITVGDPIPITSPNGSIILLPPAVATFLAPGMFYLAFGLLVGATFVASWVSKVKVINVIALFAVAGLMGFELAPMVFIAQLRAGLGTALSTDPVRDALIMTGAVFVGITVYVFYTRKDFSYLRATLNMGFWIIFAACLMTFVFHSEIFGLAVAAGGALLSVGFLLYVTSYIFRNSEMDDAVGDALALLVQLRNLFMFLLRIFMSSRD